MNLYDAFLYYNELIMDDYLYLIKETKEYSKKKRKGGFRIVNLSFEWIVKYLDIYPLQQLVH